MRCCAAMKRMARALEWAWWRVRWWRGIPEENLRRAMLNHNESSNPEDKKAARVVARIA